MKLCIDLCSGLGGFSQAFIESPDWEVVRIDIERKCKPTIQADVRFLPLRENLQPNVLLASPPCERFSLCNGSHRENIWPKKGIGIALAIVGAVLESIVYLRPKHYMIENPRARLRWFLGTPKHSIRLSDFGYKTMKPTDLWSDFDFNLVKEIRNYDSWIVTHNASERAILPLGLSQALLEAVSQE